LVMVRQYSNPPAAAVLMSSSTAGLIAPNPDPFLTLR
jgi:hypothetical protein